MKAYRTMLGSAIPPFGDQPLRIPVLQGDLERAQEDALSAAGFELVDTPPSDEPYLLFSDRIWFTAELLRLLQAHPNSRLCIPDASWTESMHPLQKLGEGGGYDLALLPAGARPVFEGVPLLALDLGLRDGDAIKVHRSMEHALRRMRIGPAMAHHVDHWSHILRINQLAIAAVGEAARLAWTRGGLWTRIKMICGLLWRARSLSKQKILSSIGPVGKNCSIHPTAVIEACVIGDNVEIGPHTVLRGSVICDGAKIEEFSSVNLSVIGAGAHVGRYGMANLCVVYDAAQISHGGGYQACVIGRGAFMAWGVNALDLSFGKGVRVEVEGEWMDSGQHFLGVAIGHGAVVGVNVTLNYGLSIPNEALVVGSAATLVRDASAAAPGVPYVVEGGKLRPLKRAQKQRPLRGE
jgi:carbonic anhydrase/acetyltransferase-like protein (isoleucine patch superfamily)